MGLYSLFFGKKINSESLSIDMNSQGVYVNDMLFELPCSIFELKKILGKFKRVPTEVGVNYYWNKLGIMCYTRNGINVHTIAVKTDNSALSTSENKIMELYKGRLTINGMDWEAVMRRGAKTEFFYRIVLANLSAVSEFGDFMDDTVLSGVEITCDSIISDNFESIAEEYGV